MLTTRKKFDLEESGVTSLAKWISRLNFFPVASEIYFFDGESTKIRLLPGLLLNDERMNQGSFVSAVCLVVCFLWFVLCLCVFLWFILSFLPYCLFVSNSQVIGWEDRLWNDLYCVGWSVKPHSIPSIQFTCDFGEWTFLRSNGRVLQYTSHGVVTGASYLHTLINTEQILSI